MKGAANGDDIVGLSRQEFLDPTVDQGECDPCFRGRSLRRLDHSCFRIERRAASDKRREANGKQSGSAANVKQGFVAAQGDLLGNFLEKLWRITCPDLPTCRHACRNLGAGFRRLVNSEQLGLTRIRYYSAVSNFHERAEASHAYEPRRTLG